MKNTMDKIRDSLTRTSIYRDLKWIPNQDWIGFRIRDFLMYFLTDETVDTDEYMCHQTRPVLLPTGWADIPYPWHPSVVDIGIYQIGNFYILSGWFSEVKIWSPVVSLFGGSTSVVQISRILKTKQSTR